MPLSSGSEEAWTEHRTQVSDLLNQGLRKLILGSLLISVGIAFFVGGYKPGYAAGIGARMNPLMVFIGVPFVIVGGFVTAKGKQEYFEDSGED